MKKIGYLGGSDLAAISSLLFIFCTYLTHAHAAEAEIFGNWVVPGADAVLSIERSNGSVQIDLVKTLDVDALDENNPDPDFQIRPLTGITIGKNFEYSGEVLRGGSLYDPGSGNSYKATITLLDENHLLVRGYIGFALIGRSQTWTRFEYFAPKMEKMLLLSEESIDDQ